MSSVLRSFQFSGQAVLDALPDPSCLIDPENFKLLAVNGSFSHLFGAADTLLGRHCHEVTHGRSEPCQMTANPCVVREVIRLGRPCRGEHIHHLSDGREQVLEASAAHLDAKDRRSPMLYTLRDRSEQRHHSAQRNSSSHIDSLTGLPNRVLFLERLAGLLDSARCEEGLIGVLFIDLDRFKGINDVLGHQSGDLLLQETARRFQLCLRKNDSMARMGGDEFLVLLPGLQSETEAEDMAGKLLEVVAAGFDLDGQDASISASIGVALFPDDGLDAESLLKNAEHAMCQAKERGHNHQQRFLVENTAGAAERLILENGLTYALERNELTLSFQPQFSLVRDQVVGCETLLRWQHPYLGCLAPAKFIPVAEESGLIQKIGEWILHEACRKAVALQKQGFPFLRMGVNISGSQFRDPQLPELVAAALRESGLRPDRLELELTESMLIEGGGETLAMLHRFKGMGLQLAIDDFGTGYSSLSYLKDFPVDRVKIDRAFVKDIGTDKDDGTLALAILDLAHSLRLHVIAEGVETVEQFQFLAQHGCEEIQGFLFSRPLSLSELVDYLRRPPGSTPRLSLDSLKGQDP